MHWSRLPSQPCRVPNRLLVSLASGSRGCLALRFSPDGLFLAAATQETPDTFPLLIYQVRLRASSHALRSALTRSSSSCGLRTTLFFDRAAFWAEWRTVE